MTEIGCRRGRQLGAADLEWIRAWLADQPTWSRWRLSRELATHWDWRTPTGQLKDMAARQLRPAVIARKLSCGNKTPAGAQAWAVLATLAATCDQTDQSFVTLISQATTLHPARGP